MNALKVEWILRMLTYLHGNVVVVGAASDGLIQVPW